MVVAAARGRGRRRVVIAVAVFLVSIAPVVDTVVAVVAPERSTGMLCNAKLDPFDLQIRGAALNCQRCFSAVG